MVQFLCPPSLRLDSEGIDLLMNLLLVSGRAAQAGGRGSEGTLAALTLSLEPGRRGAVTAE